MPACCGASRSATPSSPACSTLRIGLQHIDAERRDLWAAGWMSPKLTAFGLHEQRVGGRSAAGRVVGDHDHAHPAGRSGYGVFRADHLRLALDAAVRGGYDTDTVAAIAGGLLGAVYGASAVPAEWRRVLHGWPGLATRGLVALPAES